MFNPNECFTSDALKRRSFTPYASFNFSSKTMRTYLRLNVPATKFFIDNNVERVMVYVKNDKSGFYVVPSPDDKGSKVLQKHGSADKKSMGNGIAISCIFLVDIVKALFKGQDCRFKAKLLDDQKILEFNLENPEFI